MGARGQAELSDAERHGPRGGQPARVESVRVQGVEIALVVSSNVNGRDVRQELAGVVSGGYHTRQNAQRFRPGFAVAGNTRRARQDRNRLRGYHSCTGTEQHAAHFAAAIVAFTPCAVAQEGRGDVVYVPTPQVVVEEMLRMAKIGPKDFLIDLGSGDGRIVITAAKQFSAQGFGVDRHAPVEDRTHGRELGRPRGSRAVHRARSVRNRSFEGDGGLVIPAA